MPATEARIVHNPKDIPPSHSHASDMKLSEHHAARTTEPRWPLSSRTLCSLAVLGLLAACSGRESSAPAASQPQAAGAAASAPVDPMVVSIKGEMAARFKSEPVELRDIAAVQEVAGRIRGCVIINMPESP